MRGVKAGCRWKSESIALARSLRLKMICLNLTVASCAASSVTSRFGCNAIARKRPGDEQRQQRMQGLAVADFGEGQCMYAPENYDHRQRDDVNVHPAAHQ